MEKQQKKKPIPPKTSKSKSSVTINELATEILRDDTKLDLSGALNKEIDPENLSIQNKQKLQETSKGDVVEKTTKNIPGKKKGGKNVVEDDTFDSFIGGFLSDNIKENLKNKKGYQEIKESLFGEKKKKESLGVGKNEASEGEEKSVGVKSDKEVLEKVSDIEQDIASVKEIADKIYDRIKVKDVTVGKGKNAQTYRYDPLSPQGKQVKEISESGKAAGFAKKGDANRVLTAASYLGSKQIEKEKEEEKPNFSSVDEGKSTRLSKQQAEMIKEILERVKNMQKKVSDKKEEDKEKKKKKGDKDEDDIIDSFLGGFLSKDIKESLKKKKGYQEIKSSFGFGKPEQKPSETKSSDSVPLSSKEFETFVSDQEKQKKNEEVKVKKEQDIQKHEKEREEIEKEEKRKLEENEKTDLLKEANKKLDELLKRKPGEGIAQGKSGAGDANTAAAAGAAGGGISDLAEDAKDLYDKYKERKAGKLEKAGEEVKSAEKLEKAGEEAGKIGKAGGEVGEAAAKGEGVLSKLAGKGKDFFGKIKGVFKGSEKAAEGATKLEGSVGSRIAKVLGKNSGKILGKSVAGAGILFGLWDGVKHAAKGDWTGLALDATAVAGSTAELTGVGAGPGAVVAGLAAVASVLRDSWEDIYGFPPDKDPDFKEHWNEAMEAGTDWVKDKLGMQKEDDKKDDKNNTSNTSTAAANTSPTSPSSTTATPASPTSPLSSQATPPSPTAMTIPKAADVASKISNDSGKAHMAQTEDKLNDIHDSVHEYSKVAAAPTPGLPMVNPPNKGSQQLIELPMTNEERSVSTYTASIFDHPVVHPGLFTM